MVSSSLPSAAFRRLEVAWLRRAAARLEPALWVELIAIALLASAFLFWQAHVRLASFAHDRGPAAASLGLAVYLTLIALAGGAQAGARHWARLRERDGAPPWRALPIPDPLLSAHLVRLSSLQASWLVVPAAALLIAAAGVLPAPWLAALGAGFLAAGFLLTRFACALALSAAAWRSEGAEARLHGALARALSSASRGRTSRRLRAASWRRMRAWVALWRNDARLAWRVPEIRRRLFLATAAMALSWLAWRLPGAENAAHIVAFATSLFAAATVAEWLIAVIGADPADVLRHLPIGLGAAWGARIMWALLASGALLAGHALAAHSLPPPVLRFFLTWIALSSLAITTLGVNYGVSLYPRTQQAQRLLTLSLGLSMAASLMIPLMGWIVLLTAVLHSLRRVARWRSAEER